MHLTKTETPLTPAKSEHPIRLFLMACSTCASNIVERFHEYADACLSEELTIVEQRRRLLGEKQDRSAFTSAPTLTHRTAHGDVSGL